jgi:hypothetical protein
MQQKKDKYDIHIQEKCRNHAGNMQEILWYICMKYARNMHENMHKICIEYYQQNMQEKYARNMQQNKQQI